MRLINIGLRTHLLQLISPLRPTLYRLW
uniref:Lian-aa1 retrotransposon protein n=1 Tax=Triatoma infestans TaxID=30076 RepID=A0A161M671_TRIIF